MASCARLLIIKYLACVSQFLSCCRLFCLFKICACLFVFLSKKTAGAMAHLAADPLQELSLFLRHICLVAALFSVACCVAANAVLITGVVLVRVKLCLFLFIRFDLWLSRVHS